MGWCSGTEVFDNIAGLLVNDKPFTEDDKKRILKVLIVTLRDLDWDCEPDSDYWTHPTVRQAFKEIYPKWDWKQIEEDENE